jgi:hypothetical protein
MQEQSMEIWGHCHWCDRWFPVPSDTVEALVGTRCDLCRAAPVRLEQRLGDLVIELDVAGGRSPHARVQEATAQRGVQSRRP